MKTFFILAVLLALPSLVSAQCQTCQQQLFAQPIVQSYGVQQFVQPYAVQQFAVQPLYAQQFAVQRFVQPLAIQSYGFQQQQFVQPFRSSSLFIQRNNFGFSPFRQRGFSLSIFR